MSADEICPYCAAPLEPGVEHQCPKLPPNVTVELVYPKPGELAGREIRTRIRGVVFEQVPGVAS